MSWCSDCVAGRHTVYLLACSPYARRLISLSHPHARAPTLAYLIKRSTHAGIPRARRPHRRILPALDRRRRAAHILRRSPRIHRANPAQRRPRCGHLSCAHALVAISRRAGARTAAAEASPVVIPPQSSQRPPQLPPPPPPHRPTHSVHVSRRRGISPPSNQLEKAHPRPPRAPSGSPTRRRWRST